MTSAAVVITDTVYRSWLATGKVTDQLPPPPQLELDGRNIPSVEFIDDFLDWLDILPGGNKGALGMEVRGQVFQILNGFTVGEHVVINMRGHH